MKKYLAAAALTALILTTSLFATAEAASIATQNTAVGVQPAPANAPPPRAGESLKDYMKRVSQGQARAAGYEPPFPDPSVPGSGSEMAKDMIGGYYFNYLINARYTPQFTKNDLSILGFADANAANRWWAANAKVLDKLRLYPLVNGKLDIAKFTSDEQAQLRNIFQAINNIIHKIRG